MCPTSGRNGPIRPRRRRLWRLGSLATAGVLLAAACGGGGDDDAADASSGDRPSPLAEFMGWGDGPTPQQQAQADEQARRYEELVAGCMAAQGFEYVPVAPDFDETEVSGPRSLPEAEFVERYGYGLFTIDEVAPEENPNMAIEEAMSEAEREAYQLALVGFVPEQVIDENGEIIEEALPPPEESGCQGQAGAEVYGSAGIDERLSEYSELIEVIDRLDDGIDDDPRVADANAAWSDCMADAGYPDLAEPDDARRSVRDRGELYSVSIAEMDPEDLRQERDNELAVAQADHGCRREVDYADVRLDVRDDLEREFIEENRAELERYRDALEVATGDAGDG